MSRLIILSLPLLAIWLLFQSHPPDSRLSSERQVKEFGPVSSFELGTIERAENGATSLRSEQRYDERLTQLSPLAGRGQGSSKPPIPVELVGTPELVDFVWGEIDPALRSALSSEHKQQLREMIGRLVSPAAKEQAWICWAPGTPEETVMAFHQAEELTGMRSSGLSLFANQFLGSGHWNTTATDGRFNFQQGLPVTLTWSIAPDGSSIPGRNGGASAPSDFRSWIASIYGGSTSAPAADQPWFSIFESAFSAMEETCGVTFVYEPADDGAEVTFGVRGQLGVRGDIRLGARFVDGNNNVLAYATSPDGGEMIFDSGDASFNNTTSSSLTLFNGITHELGHAMGLAHVCPMSSTKLMEPRLVRSFRGPRFDEFQSLQRQYGDVREVSGDLRNNDNASRATVIDVLAGNTENYSRLSIDDESDVDYFSITVRGRQRLTASVEPADASYLEGAQVGENCSAGSNYNAAAQQNLSLEFLNPDGTTVLASSFAGGLGEGEEIDSVEFPVDGTYFVRVNGSDNNSAQLYDLEIFLEDRPAAPEFMVEDSPILAESGSVKNSRLDDRETVRARLDFRNVGNLGTTSLTSLIEAPANVTVFSSGTVGPVIQPGESGSMEVVFASTAVCGESITLTLVLSDDSGELGRLPFEFMVGEILVINQLAEQFDASPIIPDDWSTSFSGGGENWSVSTSRSQTPIRSAFVPGEASVSESFLVSPEVVAGAGGGTLSFANLHITENSYDGAQIQASRNDGLWFDLPSNSTVISGGYNATIRTTFGSPIAGERAWSGSAPDFFTSSFQLPAAWSGETLRFRWRLVHDQSVGRTGWYVDNVIFATKSEDCINHRPVLALSATSTALDESSPAMGAILSVSSELPLLDPVEFTLIPTGTAASDDFSANLTGTIQAGQTSIEIPITVIADAIDEGVEMLIFSLPTDVEDFAPGETATQSFTITDLSGFDDWLLSFFPSARDPLGDSDGDGFSDLAEYLLGTAPNSVTSRASLTPVAVGQSFVLPVGELPTRSDASLILQASPDLTAPQWANLPLETTPSGIQLPVSGEKRFFRLIYRLTQ